MRSILPGLIVLCIITLFSCPKNEDGLISGNPINLENGQIETSAFYGYRFEFKQVNVVTSSKSSEIIKGSWQKLNDSGK
ncbi:MAG: hypothetical protein IPN29_21720 [Saprospiraceae bacterium]|nr:hypothetical protein [Saprospiraceae bacterium]